MDNLFIAFLTLLMGVIAGVSGGLLGIGGGAVLVPLLLMLLSAAGIQGVPLMQMAVATSLASIVFTGLSSTWSHHLRGSVEWRMVALFAPGLMLGALFAGWLGALMNEHWLRYLFACFLLVVGVRLSLSSQNSKIAEPKPIKHSRVVALTSLPIGLFSALVGIGGGSLTVPLLRRMGRRMQLAVGTSSACGVPIAVAGTLGWMAPGWQSVHPWAMGYVLLPVAALLGLGAIIGARWGVALAHRLPAATLQAVFGLVIIAIGGYLLSPLARW
jgi:hypothetical protein